MVTVEEFNRMDTGWLRPALLDCCDAPEWADALLDSRPYPDLPSLLAAADEAVRALTPAGVDRALAAHPRIGEQPPGGSRGAAWSREEQSGVDSGVETIAALHSANRLYENRFGRVFLICATGLSTSEILAALLLRLANDEATEAAVVAVELRKIAMLRLRKVIVE
ncbi:2-oxo-4-hydroxy-4-carboxy-5-ureidoimidazoline decarboxylase [Nocardia huaxiensis]|uniref:2-oxo-4-hydroxy-4-carboxy-5-ureidoimidazoline decarboxylase n=1 Tax=Nocardia huaxiensis TaxID=2755382 RepID=A0A7D6ZIZ8_9NOCA|nr:2-oxo-4-hydroxy-4-carboxy-5-ureidoimidazoline decarboxylase [Nocardia huaxiensis]QLY28903.1 2-oxo-4-hydroxy-4-carboxy-5-ureidoimidazoline decarboxylase [Nocardia huaxiensis]UFS97621.1 2-oxo-4-hydroxy-4-carboxy-5-ureidoimidazoline decarboxylase [Nocardia huaxiensis]